MYEVKQRKTNDPPQRVAHRKKNAGQGLKAQDLLDANKDPSTLRMVASQVSVVKRASGSGIYFLVGSKFLSTEVSCSATRPVLASDSSCL
jgi:hypothetical protein